MDDSSVWHEFAALLRSVRDSLGGEAGFDPDRDTIIDLAAMARQLGYPAPSMLSYEPPLWVLSVNVKRPSGDAENCILHIDAEGNDAANRDFRRNAGQKIVPVIDEWLAIVPATNKPQQVGGVKETKSNSGKRRDDAARLSVFKYIELFYNTERLHQALDYQSPNQFEAERAPAQAA